MGRVRAVEKDASDDSFVKPSSLAIPYTTTTCESGRWDSNPRRPAWEGGGKTRAEWTARQVPSEDAMLTIRAANLSCRIRHPTGPGTGPGPGTVDSPFAEAPRFALGRCRTCSCRRFWGRPRPLMISRVRRRVLPESGKLLSKREFLLCVFSFESRTCGFAGRNRHRTDTAGPR